MNDKIKIGGQCVNHQPASRWARLVALVIDLMIVFGVSIILISIPEMDITPGRVIIVALVLGFVYDSLSMTYNHGQTLGKALMKIRVIQCNGREVCLRSAVSRYIGYFLGTVLWLMGLFVGAADLKNDNYHDLMAGTKVIKVQN